MTNLASRATLAFAAAVFFAGVASSADFVVLKNGTKHRGKVVRDDARGVTLKAGGEIEFKRADVAEVIYDDERPVEYKIGIESYKVGRYDAALESLEAAVEAQHHPLLEQYILYYLGLSSQKLGRLDKAVGAFEKLKEQGGKTRFLVDAVGSLVQLELARDKPKAALKHLNDLMKLRAAVDPASVMLLKARIAEKLGRFSEARDLYRKSAEGSKDETAEEAELGVARCSIGMKKHDEASKMLEDFVSRERSDKASAQAYVLLGDALKALAKSPLDWEKAMLAYMRVPCLYRGDEATEAKALYEAARCFKAMNAENSVARASTLLSRLKARYPRSKWAGMAP